MSHDVPESDWKVFRELRELALERFCKRTLEELEPLRRHASRSHHERYRAIYRLLRERDEQLARAFDDPRRSRMIAQLAAIHTYGLLEPEELARFTSRTRTTIEGLAVQLVRQLADRRLTGAGRVERSRGLSVGWLERSNEPP